MKVITVVIIVGNKKKRNIFINKLKNNVIPNLEKSKILDFSIVGGKKKQLFPKYNKKQQKYKKAKKVKIKQTRNMNMSIKYLFTLLFIAAIAFGEVAEKPAEVPTEITEEENAEAEAEAEAAADSPVKEITLETFFSTINDNEYVLMEFYASWCGHCKQFAPVYEEIAKHLEGTVTVARVDADKYSAIAMLQELQSFPTIKLFVKSVPVTYFGSRTFDDVIKFVSRAQEPSYTELKDAASFDAFVAAHPKNMIACFGDNATEIGHLREMFEDIALQIHISTDVSFAVYEDKDAVGVPSCPGIAVRNPDYPDPFVYDIGTYLDVDPEDLPHSEEEEVKKEEDVKEEEEEEEEKEEEEVKKEGEEELPKRSPRRIVRWLSECMLPLVDEVSGKNFDKYARLERPMVWLVMRETNSEALKTFTEVAQEYALRASFVWLNDTLYHIQTKLIGVPEDSAFPTVAISKKLWHSAFSKEQTAAGISKEALRAFVDAYLAGTLLPTVRSAPVPDKAENEAKPFRTLVRSNWEETVLDPTKDVLVEFYSSWCKNCLALSSMFEDLGKALRPVESFFVGGIELSENDFPEDVEISGFPHIVLFPAGEKKKTPVVLNDDIVLTKMIKFVQKNAG